MSEERFDIEEIIAEIKSDPPPKKVSDSAPHGEVDGSRPAKPANNMNHSSKKPKQSSKSNPSSISNKKSNNKIQKTEKKEPELFSGELDELFRIRFQKRRGLFQNATKLK